MKKLDYSKAYRKKLVQQVVFDDFKERGITKLVGLAGPNITDYLSFVKSKGIKQAEVYERDYIKKFKKNAIVTLALRKIGLMPTLKKFCKIVSNLKPEIKLNVELNPNYKVHLLNLGEESYTVYQYHDTTPMCLIKPNF